MPYPNEHACRLRAPGDFEGDSFRRISRTSDGKKYDVIVGRLKGESSMTEQAYRYAKTTWTAASARSHCESHDGKAFEPASEKKTTLYTGGTMNERQEIETRASVGEVSVFQDDEAAQPRLIGRAIPYLEWSEVLGNFRERIKPGAFDDSIEAGDVRAFFNHDSSFVLGRQKNGTLRLRSAPTGVFYELDPPATSWARDLLETIKRGDIDGNSFAFRVSEDGESWTRGTDGLLERTIHRAALIEVGPQTLPAYPQTSVVARALERGIADVTAREGEAAVVLARGRLQALRVELAQLDLDLFEDVAGQIAGLRRMVKDQLG